MVLYLRRGRNRFLLKRLRRNPNLHFHGMSPKGPVEHVAEEIPHYGMGPAHLLLGK